MQLAIDHNTAVNLQSGVARQRRFRAQAGGGHHRIDGYRALAIETDANAVGGLLQPLQLRFQHQMYAHLGEPMLQAAAGLRRHQRRQHAGGVIDYRYRFTGAAEIHRQFAANQAAADDQHALRVVQLALRRAIFALAIER